METIIRLLSIGESLYWLVGSFVVLGGFVVFIGAVLHDVWTSRAQRPQAWRRDAPVNVYIENLHVSVEHDLALPTGRRLGRELVSDSEIADIRALILETLTLLETTSDEEAAQALKQRWDERQLRSARALCERARTEADIPSALRLRLEAACAFYDDLTLS